MKNRRWWLLVLSVGIVASNLIGCKPRTTAQKIEDKAEDTKHEMDQGMERAKENTQ